MNHITYWNRSSIISSAIILVTSLLFLASVQPFFLGSSSTLRRKTNHNQINYGYGWRNERVSLIQTMTNNNNNDDQRDYFDDKKDGNKIQSSSSSYYHHQQRRLFLSTISTTAATLLTLNENNNANAISIPFLGGGEPRKTSFNIISNRANSTSATAIRQPTYDEDLATESCLLGLLPTKVKEFRSLEKDILKVSILREKSDEGM